MNKTLKTLFYILCVCSLLVGFGACASNKPKPEQKPEPVKPAEPARTPEQEKTARLLDEMAKAPTQIPLIPRNLNRRKIRQPKQERIMNRIILQQHKKRLKKRRPSIVL